MMRCGSSPKTNSNALKKKFLVNPKSLGLEIDRTYTTLGVAGGDGQAKPVAETGSTGGTGLDVAQPASTRTEAINTA
jgi:hypothetical protein